MLQLIGPHLQASLVTVLRLSLWLTILVAVFVPLERLFAAHPQKFLRRGIGVDLGYYFLSSLLPALLLSVPISFLAWIVHRAVPGGLLAATAAMPLAQTPAVGLLNAAQATPQSPILSELG